MYLGIPLALGCSQSHKLRDNLQSITVYREILAPVLFPPPNSPSLSACEFKSPRLPMNVLNHAALSKQTVCAIEFN